MTFVFSLTQPVPFQSGSATTQYQRGLQVETLIRGESEDQTTCEI